MDLYIDKNNLISFVKNSKNPLFDECQRLIRSNMVVHYNFSKNEMLEDEFVSYWCRLMPVDAGDIHKFCPPENVFPERPLKINFRSSLTSENFFSFFLLDDENKCDLVAQKSCILIGKVGEEISTISKLLIGDNEKLAININWSDYFPKLPLSDLILADNHYFKHKNVYFHNDNELIKKLASIPSNSPLNVIIITKKDEVDSNIDLKAEQMKMTKLVKNLTKSTKSTVTILTTYKTHDRTLITNYYRVKHGSCFHLKENGLKGDVTIEIKSHAIIHNLKMTRTLIEVYQEIASNPLECFGEGKSNLLTINNMVTK
jgi:hypothetical protein